MAQGTLSIHSENILPILKKWLYSDKEIFLRELVSNSSDALQKLKILQNNGSAPKTAEEFRIDLQTNKEKNTISISDNGIGMTQEEVEKYIAQLAFSGAGEFLEKYKSQKEKDPIIGHFGLGFYSAYMVSEKATIDTLSFLPSSNAAFWSCDGSSVYSIEKGTKESRGTTVTLFIDKEHREFLEEERLRTILLRYCPFLPFPIYLNGNHINNKDPLWLKAPSECTEKDYLSFYQDLYPWEPDPIFWISLNIDYPFHLKGILFFPKLHRSLEQREKGLKLFCNRIFVADNGKELLPDFLATLQGAIDSAELPLNVSRSALQRDKNVQKLGDHIAKKIADRLLSLYTQEKETFLSIWKEVEIVVKLGILQEEKFYEKTKKILLWQNVEGKWLCLEEYLEKQKGKKIFYTEQHFLNPHLIDLFRSQNIEILKIQPPIDLALISFLESKLPEVKFQRIDGGIDPLILDTSREKNLLDDQGISEKSKIASFVKSSLEIEDLEVEAQSLSNDSLSGFLLLKEQERRVRDFFSMTQDKKPLPQAKKTFVINTNHKLLSIAFEHKEKKPSLAKKIVRHLYDLSLLSQKELEPLALSEFITRSHQLLEEALSSKED